MATHELRTLTVETPSRAHLDALLAEGEGTKISLFVPVVEDPSFDEQSQTKVHLENLRREAGRRLAAARESEDWLSPLDGLRIEPNLFPPGTRGLALYLAGGNLRAFALHEPIQRAALRVQSTYALRPLVAELQRNQRYRLIALAAGCVELYEGDRYGLGETQAPEVPSDLHDALGHEIRRTSNSLQWHAGSLGGDAAIFHGHGGPDRGRNVDRDRFHGLLAREIGRVWGARHDPLVLAADAAHQGRFRIRAEGELHGLLEDGVAGSPERQSAREFAEAAWPLVAAWQTERQREREAQIPVALAHGAATDDLERAVEFASSARVARLWLAEDASREGRIDTTTGKLVEAEGEDLYDGLAALVLEYGGEVWITDRDLPGNAAFVAELRR
ncbi:MAG: hypothetical protein WD226_13800 [Planctomycetota bacterium]